METSQGLLRELEVELLDRKLVPGCFQLELRIAALGLLHLAFHRQLDELEMRDRL
jgi:hypothetical protein